MKFGIFYEPQLPRPGTPATRISSTRTPSPKSNSPTNSVTITPIPT